MATATAVITEALLQLGVIRPGQSAASTELNTALSALNRMIDSWSTERLLLPVVGATFYTLVGGQASYTVGTSGGAGLNSPRPLRIDGASFVQGEYNSSTLIAGFNTRLKMISEVEYQSITDKTATSDIAEKLYYAPSTPLGVLNIWPIPNCVTPCQLQCDVWTPLSQFPDLTTDIVLYPGLERALSFNLAIEASSDYPAVVLKQSTVSMAGEAKQSIMKLNALMLPTVPDIAIPPIAAVQFEPVPAGTKAVAQAKFGGTPAQ